MRNSRPLWQQEAVAAMLALQSAMLRCCPWVSRAQRARAMFDGVCVLCSRGCGFVSKCDRRGYFRFVPMQLAEGRPLAEQLGITTREWHGWSVAPKRQCGRSRGRTGRMRETPAVPWPPPRSAQTNRRPRRRASVASRPPTNTRPRLVRRFRQAARCQVPTRCRWYACAPDRAGCRWQRPSGRGYCHW